MIFTCRRSSALFVLFVIIALVSEATRRMFLFCYAPHYLNEANGQRAREGQDCYYGLLFSAPTRPTTTPPLVSRFFCGKPQKTQGRKRTPPPKSTFDNYNYPLGRPQSPTCAGGAEGKASGARGGFARAAGGGVWWWVGLLAVALLEQIH